MITVGTTVFIITMVLLIGIVIGVLLGYRVRR